MEKYYQELMRRIILSSLIIQMMLCLPRSKTKGKLVRKRFVIKDLRRKRVQSVAKKLNNGMEMTLAVCLFVWAVNG